MTYVLGLTGGIASGKSTVSNYLYEQGAAIIDADEVAREVVRPDTEGLASLKQKFGKQIIAADGTLKRRALGEIIFNDPAQRDLVNSILHPLITKKMLGQVKAAKQRGVDLVVLDVPLLFETHGERYCDGVLVVDIDPQLQLERLIKRNGYSRQEAQARMASQMSVKERRKRADFLVDNNGSEKETYQQIDVLLEKILA